MFALGLSMLLAANNQPVVAQASCTNLDTLPAVSYSPDPLPIVQMSGEHGVVRLIVTLNAGGGRPAAVSLDQTSGSGLLDNAAIAQTLRSEFASESENCAPVSGRYIYYVQY